jgi:uncharacterized protein YbjT (DUF2867 family)
MRALIVGASGYNSGNVARRLIDDGHTVRGFVRDIHRATPELQDVVQGDVVTGVGLNEALTDIDVAFYFVHALDSADGRIHERDTASAHRFVTAAHETGLSRAVFFTTLAPPDGVEPPAYQRNRLAVERILLDGIAGTTVVRAGLVAGAQSRGLLPYVRMVQRFPVVALGRWRSNRIAVVDPDTATAAIITAAEDGLEGRILDVPASAEPTHEQLVRAIARSLGLRRLIVASPLPTPRLDVVLLRAVTGQSYGFCRYLLSVNAHDYVIDADRAAPLAGLEPLPFHRTLDQALADYPARESVPDRWK